ncbi:MAG TPA: dephospho-CoA kinase [Vicinamibacterales bacterium]|nr:dephospho-CoA kinase [Vicinamibacterales bacterium]HPW20920.1 dephospho-CoA kinase [Vicinamibacterales bacterium]
MLRVALTGGIGTGKSVALARFAELGAAVIDADDLAHRAMQPGSEGHAAIRRRFGEGVIGADGRVDRARLGAVVFADDDARRDLEAIIHPAVARAIAAWLTACERQGVRIAIAEIPLLHETGRDKDFACVVVTACEESEQVRRVMARSGVDEPEARRRMAAQWPAAKKARRADYVIRTDGPLAETRRRTTEVWRALSARPDVGYSSWSREAHAPGLGVPAGRRPGRRRPRSNP